jgi:hypothetical protein
LGIRVKFDLTATLASSGYAAVRFDDMIHQSGGPRVKAFTAAFFYALFSGAYSTYTSILALALLYVDYVDHRTRFIIYPDREVRDCRIAALDAVGPYDDTVRKEGAARTGLQGNHVPVPDRVYHPLCVGLDHKCLN